MPNFKKGFYLDSLNKVTVTKTWDATSSNILDSEHMRFDNPPFEVGLWSIFIKTTDTGGGTPNITVDLIFSIDQSGTYYDDTAIRLSDIHGNDSFTSGETFCARLDTNTKWLFNNGFKIRLTRDAGSALTINHAEVTAI